MFGSSCVSEDEASDERFLIAIALKPVPEEILSSVSYSEQVFLSTHDAIIDDKCADENDDKSDAQKAGRLGAPEKIELPFAKWSFERKALLCQIEGEN